MAPVSDQVKAATEVAVRLKRCLSIFRLYTAKHDLAVGALDELHSNAAKHLEALGALRFDVESNRLLSEGAVVLEDDGRQESILMRLYSEGVTAIIFAKGIQREELSRYVEFWWQALSGFVSSEHSFSTLVWEAEFRSVVTEFRERLDLSDGDKSDKAAARKSVLDAAYAAAPPSIHNSEASNLEKLVALAGAPGLENLSPRPLDFAMLAFNQQEEIALSKGIASDSEGVAARALVGVWTAFPYVSPALKDRLISFVASIYLELLSLGTLDLLETSLAKIGPESGSSHDRFDEFLGPLCTEALVDKIAAHLSTPNEARARAILALLPDAVIGTLVGRLQNVGANDRRAILEILKTKQILPEDFALLLLDLGPLVATHLFELAAAFSQDHTDVLTRAALLHDDPAVRSKAISGIHPSRVSEYRTLLLRAVRDSDSRVRDTAIGVFVRTKQPEALALLEIQLRSADAAPTVRAQAAKSLLTLSGDRPRVLLEGVLRNPEESMEARATAAGALGSFEVSRAILEIESRKRFTDSAVRDACKSALKRLDESKQKGAP